MSINIIRAVRLRTRVEMEITRGKKTSSIQGDGSGVVLVRLLESRALTTEMFACDRRWWMWTQSGRGAW